MDGRDPSCGVRAVGEPPSVTAVRTDGPDARRLAGVEDDPPVRVDRERLTIGELVRARPAVNLDDVDLRAGAEDEALPIGCPFGVGGEPSRDSMRLRAGRVTNGPHAGPEGPACTRV